MNEKTKVARLSIFSNTFLIIIKLTTGFISGSVSIISEAIHSAIDLLAATIAYLAVRVSDKPADEKHPYGHGKFENISAAIEAILIFIAAGWIIYEAAKKLTGTHEVVSIGLGSAVMFVSAGVNFWVSRKLYITAKKTDSVALEADALHLKTDVYTSLGVALGLGLMWITGWHILDPIVAIVVALLILKEAFHLLKNAYAPLLDEALSEAEIQIIKQSIEMKNLRFHDLKTRKSGSYKFADLHLEMYEGTPLNIVHSTCDEIEDDIKTQIKNIEIHIHVEPIAYSS